MRSIEKPLYHLLKNEPFYAHFLLGSQIIFDRKEIERAAASIDRSGVKFYFNSEWLSALPINQQIGVLKHEVLHVLLGHCNSRGKLHFHKLAKNIAMDCAINQHIDESDLPIERVTLKSVSDLCKKQLAPFECWEYYYDQLKQAVENQPDEPHDHDKMEEGDGDSFQDPNSGKAIYDAMVKDLTQKAIKASAGNIPGSLVSVIQGLTTEAKVSWKQQLRNLISKARSIKYKNSRHKVHRRFELDQPGKLKKRELTIGVCVDTSGSVSDDVFTAFMNEVHHLSKISTKTYLIQADSAVAKVDVIKSGKPKPGMLTTRHGNGGTAYQPAINKCLTLKCDVIIYFGDMDASDVPTNPGTPFIWAVAGSGTPPGKFGKDRAAMTKHNIIEAQLYYELYPLFERLAIREQNGAVYQVVKNYMNDDLHGAFEIVVKSTLKDYLYEET